MVFPSFSNLGADIRGTGGIGNDVGWVTPPPPPNWTLNTNIFKFKVDFHVHISCIHISIIRPQYIYELGL